MSSLIMALAFRAIKKTFDAAQPRPEILEAHHGVRERLEIGDEKIKFDWSYLKGTSDENLIVFMHGFGSDEMQWEEPGLFSSKQILVMEDLLDEEPNVLTISLGKSWCISDDVDRRKGDKDAIVELIMGAIDNIEKRFLPLGAKKRLLFGVSMGGFNALQLWAHRPEHWAECMVMNPLLKYPYSKVKLPCDLLLNLEFKDDERADQMPNYSKGLARVDKNHPPLRMFSASRDEFGFYDAAMDYHENLVAKDMNVSLVISPGGHHDFEPIIAASMINELFAPKPILDTPQDPPPVESDKLPSPSPLPDTGKSKSPEETKEQPPSDLPVEPSVPEVDPKDNGSTDG